MKKNDSKKQSTFTQKSRNFQEEQENLKSRPEARNGAKSHNSINEKNNHNARKKIYQQNVYEEEEDFLRDSRTEKNKNSNILLIGACIIIVVLLLLVILLLFSKGGINSKNKSENNQLVNTEMVKTEKDDENNDFKESENSEEGTTLDNSFETGDSNVEAGKYEEGVLTKTTPEYYSSTDYLKDLNGYEIPAVYTIQNITYDVAHVNYQSKRATIDDGMEFYWLEIDYNGKKYRTQCSYNMFRNLETEGICKVAVEILTLDSGQQVVSYMKVVSEEYTKEDAENDYNF